MAMLNNQMVSYLWSVTIIYSYHMWWSGWWYTYPSEKYEFVSWDFYYIIPNIWKVIKIHGSSHHQAVINCGCSVYNIFTNVDFWVTVGHWINWIHEERFFEVSHRAHPASQLDILDSYGYLNNQTAIIDD